MLAIGMTSGKKIDPRAYEKHWKVRALWAIDRLYAHAWHRIEVTSPCRLPREGPAILVCNHSAGIDPLLLQATCPRIITWMMAREYYELPILKSAFKQLGYIPVSRGERDSASIKAALRALHDGKVLGIFPEGRIEPSLALMPFQPGVEVLAARAKVPIYPAYVAGIERNISLPRSMVDRQETQIRYGPAIDSTDRAVTTDEIRAAIEALRLQSLAPRSLRH